MPFVPVPNVCKVYIQGLIANTLPWGHVFHLTFTGGSPPIGTLDSAAIFILGQFNTQIMKHCSSDRSTTACTITDLTSQLGAQGTGGNGVAGSLTVAVIPASTSVVVSKLIPRRYRGGHPRCYL